MLKRAIDGDDLERRTAGAPRSRYGRANAAASSSSAATRAASSSRSRSRRRRVCSTGERRSSRTARERHLRRHVAPQQVQHDRDGDGERADQERGIQERHGGPSLTSAGCRAARYASSAKSSGCDVSSCT